MILMRNQDVDAVSADWRFIMKTMTLRILVLAGLLSLSGCITLSVQPLYTDADIVVEPLLAGLWGDPDGENPETWQFTSNQDNTYRLIVRDQDTLRVDPARDGIFIATLVRLNDRLYLDIYPEEPEVGSEFYRSHVIPGHSFWSVKLEGHVLSLRTLDYDILSQGLETGRYDVDFYEQKGLFMLTADTAKLQALVVEYGEELFTDVESMTRVR
jgi:hypothetical protein